MSIHLFISLMLSLSFRFRWYSVAVAAAFHHWRSSESRPAPAYRSRACLPCAQNARRCHSSPSLRVKRSQPVQLTAVQGPPSTTSLAILPHRSSNISGAHCRWSLRSHMADRWRCQAIRLLRPLLQHGLVFEAAANTERSSLSIRRAAEIR